ncbi:MAG: diaminopimelate epimerase [Gemmatimonadetes bacterium]|nr:diaminopimelate epimerase [Gemmatimonadota bacterium]
MSGSGNDFVFIDARTEPAGELATPPLIARLCARGTGIGADGLVQIRPSAVATFGIDYWNSDGSLASLCGNATLCATRLGVLMQAAEGGLPGFTIETGAGVVSARSIFGSPEFDLAPVSDIRASFEAALAPGEVRVGYVLAGVPHLVVLVDGAAGADQVPLSDRGPGLRNHPALPAGANVNWVGRRGDGTWAMRTFERGVEGETLACGTGAVATAILLGRWGMAGAEVGLETRSGRVLTVRVGDEVGGAVRPTLKGEGRLVFEGTFADV